MSEISAELFKVAGLKLIGRLCKLCNDVLGDTIVASVWGKANTDNTDKKETKLNEELSRVELRQAMGLKVCMDYEVEDVPKHKLWFPGHQISWVSE